MTITATRSGPTHDTRALAAVMAERDQLMALVGSLTRECALTKATLVANESTAIANERDRIARDLHDTVIQRLFAVGIGLQGAALVRGISPAATERLVEEIDEAIREIRTSIFHLQRPTPLLGISVVLRATLEEFRRILPGSLTVDVIEDIDRHVGPDMAKELLALVRVSLMNIVMHAKATTVRFSIVVDTPDLLMRVQDDGIGFDPTVVTGGHGLLNLHDRAASMGGSCRCTSVVGNGTDTLFRLPLRAMP